MHCSTLCRIAIDEERGRGPANRRVLSRPPSVRLSRSNKRKVSGGGRSQLRTILSLVTAKLQRIGVIFRSPHSRIPLLPENLRRQRTAPRSAGRVLCRRGEIRRLIINLPPRSLKSHCVSLAFPAFLLGRIVAIASNTTHCTGGSLCFSQRDHWVHLGCAACWEIAGQHGHCK